MPRGADPKREREYNDLKDEFKKERRYPGREEEVAARIVNKQRRQYGETRDAQEKDRTGRSPDRGLPIGDYEQLTVPEITRRLADLGKNDLRKIKRYEEQHKGRKGVLGAIGRQLAA